MRKVLESYLTKILLFSGLVVITLLSVTRTQLQTSEESTKKTEHVPQVSRVKIETIEQKNIPAAFVKQTIPSPQLHSYKKTNPQKNKLLNNILTNDKKREKFEYVMKKAAELKLPAELALIPVIESEYNNKAVSHKGAGGLWQLMPGTAKIFGLSKKQRFEMAASTRAALLHLKDLHKEFGNWEFAIAAYNAGDGRVTKALHRNSQAKTVQDLKLPRETRNYVLTFFQLKKELESYTV